MLGLIAAAVALLAGAPAADAGTAERPFSPESFWNERLGDGAPLAADSGQTVQKLVNQTRSHDEWINTTEYSAPVYTVSRKQATVPVHVDTPSSMFTNADDAARLERRLSEVPIPPAARPADGTDRHMVIWQPATDRMWELWIAHHSSRDGCEWGHDEPGWHAAWGARINRVSKHPGRVPAPFGARASGLPMAGGLIRTSELDAGRIDHALALAVPEVTPEKFVWPATRTDGDSTSPNAIPEGTRFRLPRRLRIGSLGLPPAARAIARAAKRHGIVIVDRAGAVVFYGEDPAPRQGPNPYVTLFEGRSPAELLERFPWRRLQTLAPRPPSPDERRGERRR